MIICAGNEEVFDFAVPIGVGLINSAINLTKICIERKPKFLLFIGSAGSYGRLKIFDVFESCEAANIEHCALTPYCYTPLDDIFNFIISYEKINNISKLVNSSNYITTSKMFADEYLKIGCEAENMEFYSVLKVALEFNLPVLGVFVISNYCYENAQDEYQKNIKKAKKVLIEYLENKYKDLLYTN